MAVKKRVWDNGKKSCWEFCITIQKKPRKQYRKSGFKTKLQAIEAEQEAITRLRAGENLNAEKLLFKYISNIYLDHVKKQCEESTYNHYKMIYDKHLIIFHNKQLQEITPLFIQNWIDNTIQEKSPFVINSSIKFCKTVYNYALKNELLNKNPFKNIKKVEERPKEHGHLNLEKAMELLSVCKKHYPKYYPILATALFTGMRRGEILGLQWSDIDVDNRKIYIRRQLTKEKLKDKTKTLTSTRCVDIVPSLLNILLEHKKSRKVLSKFVFCNKFGKTLSPHNVGYRDFNNVLEKAGYEKTFMRFHDLRGTYVDVLLSNGIPIKYIQTQVGHTKISTTMDIYSKLLPEINSRAIDILETSINCEQIVSK